MTVPAALVAVHTLAASSTSLSTVCQLRTVLVVCRTESKWEFVSLVLATPFGKCRKISAAAPDGIPDCKLDLLITV